MAKKCSIAHLFEYCADIISFRLNLKKHAKFDKYFVTLVF
jgi:hypothetical protein